MKIALLTTDTLHHTYFFRELSRTYSIDTVIIEKLSSAPLFETHHSYEDDRDSYERSVFFHGADISIHDVADCLTVDAINCFKTVQCLSKTTPDVVIVFGTSKLGREIIDCCPRGIINLHGGDPEYYRGLDSHLWAIYHNDFTGLITTLHRVNQDLDAGEIINQGAVPVFKGMGLHELRHHNTDICLMLVLSALDFFSRYGDFLSRPQRKQGRYYSFMPSVLKEICVKKFRNYAEGIDELAR
ncbi:MAG TPA: formyltransferase family protein [Syntrophomonadaceae bacterium]|nr:formyltransferase family protein [Syntrophomonadaceae bacterium]